MTITIRRHHVIGVLIMLVGLIVMPDGPWYRELPGLMLLLLGARVYDGRYPR